MRTTTLHRDIAVGVLAAVMVWAALPPSVWRSERPACPRCPTCPAQPQRPSNPVEHLVGRLATGDTHPAVQRFQPLPPGGDAALDIPKGYPPHHAWWFDTTLEDEGLSFRLANLSALYPSDYHSPYSKVAHPSGTATNRYARYVAAYCAMFHKRPCTRVLELGAAFCFHSEKLQKLFREVVSVEGAPAAVALCRSDFHTPGVVHHDLRLPLPRHIGGGFDIALNTEVSEHIEPPFASQLVLSLVARAPLVWFTFAPRMPKSSKNTAHHSNTQPLTFWVRLFGFYGFLPLSVPKSVVTGTYLRAGLIFYDPGRFDLEALGVEPLLRPPERFAWVRVLPPPITEEEASRGLL